MQDQAARQIGSDQTLMRGRKDEAAAHHVQPISYPVILMENRGERRPLAGRDRRRIALVVEGMRRSVGKQRNVAGDQLARRAALRILQHGRAAEYDVIGDLAELGCRKVDAPGRAKKASVIERSSDRDHLQKPAQPVAGILHLDLVYETKKHIFESLRHL
jgi:hypothetical protein